MAGENVCLECPLPREHLLTLRTREGLVSDVDFPLVPPEGGQRFEGLVTDVASATCRLSVNIMQVVGVSGFGERFPTF